MNDSNSNMPIARQLRYQKQCRDNWKENATRKQEKIREYVQLTRALKHSRDSWKKRAKTAEGRVKELEKQLSQYSSASVSKSPSQLREADAFEEHPSKIFRHHYQVSTISLAVRQIINVGHTYRGVAKTMGLISRHSKEETPHYSSIKSWVERIGLFELQRQPERRDDWIFIADLTVEWGDRKALVIYGLSQELWLTRILPSARAVKASNGRILALEVTNEATGDWIYSVLKSVSSQVGIPLQIIADRASNLKKGIQLFQIDRPQVIYTYDVTHAMANLLKKELFKNETFSNFLADCHECRLQTLQTELAFAAPPRQRSQCRFFNLDPLINWASCILNTNLTSFAQLLPHLSFSKLSLRLEEKLSWLTSYRVSLWIWKQLLFLTRSLEKQLKTKGLNSDSIPLFNDFLYRFDFTQFFWPFARKLLSYLEEQTSFSADRALLATSDVLESIFGRYKHFSGRSPLKELRSTLLTIPLTTINLTDEVIREALTSVRSSDLSAWLDRVFGQSLLSKRTALFQQ